jgi:vanillate/4-hydroxybenzoate decarboxylase subunit C
MSMLYGQSKYKMAAVLQGKPYPVARTDKGLDAPWGSEYVLEGRILARKREPEGPFGEFPGQYSGGHCYPVIEIDRVSHCKDPIYEALYLGMPWTELDYMCAVNTCAPLYVQLKKDIPEVVAVNDATTPVWPDRRGNFGQQLDSPQQTDQWRTKLGAMVKELRK